MAVVATAVGVLVLAVIGLGISALLLNAKKNEAEANLRLAAEAVDQLLAEMGREASAYGQLPQAERILDQATRFYQQLIAQSNDPAILRRAAIAHNHIGWLNRVLGRHELAIQKYHAALRLLSLVDGRQKPPATEILPIRAAAYDGIGVAYMNRFSSTHDAAAESYLAQACAIWQHLVDTHPDNIGYVDGLVGTLNSQAVIYMEDRERLQEAEAIYRQILERRQQLPRQHRQTPHHLNTTAGVLCNLGTLAVERGRLTEAEPLFREAITKQEEVVALKSGASPYDEDLYKFRWNLVDLFVRQGRHAEASAAAEKLAEQFPNGLQAHFEAADLLLRCADLAEAAANESSNGGEAPRYVAAARQLIAAADQVEERSPNMLGFFAWFLLFCRDESFRDPARALALADAGLVEAPRHEMLNQMRGIALYRLGQYKPAIDALQQSAAPRGKASIVDVLFLAMSHWQLGNQKEAREWYNTGVDWFSQRRPKRHSVYDLFAPAHADILAETKALLEVKPK
jgi:tetratricopeptide (TPR) repeat protein